MMISLAVVSQVPPFPLRAGKGKHGFVPHTLNYLLSDYTVMHTGLFAVQNTLERTIHHLQRSSYGHHQ